MENLAGYNMLKKLMKRDNATVVPYMSSQSKLRSHCNVCTPGDGGGLKGILGTGVLP